MIRKIKHKGLKRLFETGDASKVNPAHVERLNNILFLLDTATEPEGMDIPGWNLHPLTGKKQGEWSVKVSGSWRVTFRFEGQDATDINYENYH